MEVEVEDLSSFDEDLSDCLHKLPTENLPLVSPNLTCIMKPEGEGRKTVSHNVVFSGFQLEEAAKEVADEVTRPRPVGEEAVQDIQVMLKSDAHHASIRSLKVPSRLIRLIFSSSPATI